MSNDHRESPEYKAAHAEAHQVADQAGRAEISGAPVCPADQRTEMLRVHGDVYRCPGCQMTACVCHNH